MLGDMLAACIWRTVPKQRESLMSESRLRDDLIIREVLAKCDVLRTVGFWPPEKELRPRAWLNNFEEEDRGTAALLLDKFNYYNGRLTDALLLSSFHSLGDGLPKAPNPNRPEVLLSALNSAVFTPVRGEHPNPTDSGNLFCRKARQILDIDETRIVETNDAISAARTGKPVVFLDDFIGSGDQFRYTWTRHLHSGTTFESIQDENGFTAIYIALVATDFGVKAINSICPNVSLCATHILTSSSTIDGVFKDEPEVAERVDKFLRKYCHGLTPKEDYIANNSEYLAYGYKKRGLLFGFEHSIPDATLPIFWAPGPNDWEPLIERK